MKLRISRISKSKYVDKNFEDVVSNLLTEKETFINYKLDEAKSGNSKLVFKNSNYIKMLIKAMSNTFSYVFMTMFMAVVVTYIVAEINPYGGTDFANTSIAIVVLGVLFLLWMLFNSDEPYALIFNGVILHEKNPFGKTIQEFSPLKIENSNSEQFGKDFISLSTQKGKTFITSWELLIILDDDKGNGKNLIDKHFRSFCFENSIK